MIDATSDAEKSIADAGSDDEITLDLRRWFINGFIIFHLCAICCSMLPSSQLQMSAAGFFRNYLMITGTWQSWCMFSPNPVQVNTYLGATIHYANGTSREYTFPRISQLGFVEKYRQERWRKFIENTQPNSDASYWPYLARYAAIANNVSPKANPVVFVQLYRHQQTIPEPGNEPPRYLPMSMGTYHVFAMPSAGPLLADR